ncbi:hypothetical protein FX016_16255 [Cupriavidus gilardii]|uniref:Uncharacterized protein n=1 Tax=Cupriavidus cauae TaxID=2608999 RepID=A0A5M8ASZ5_9BURK|nr:hypothetical protein FX016_16255 [Cupriavidus gilardii]KAA6125215.1 hypothetical protein F1599_10480 [Cupriavidus cauae]
MRVSGPWLSALPEPNSDGGPFPFKSSLWLIFWLSNCNKMRVGQRRDGIESSDRQHNSKTGPEQKFDEVAPAADADEARRFYSWLQQKCKYVNDAVTTRRRRFFAAE